MSKTTLKNSLNSRLTQYTALTAAIAGVTDVVGQESGPTVVNTDISGITYNLDMDGDGTVEFRFNNTVAENLFLQALIPGAEAIGASAVVGTDTYIYPFALNSGDPISAGATGNWFNDTYQSMVGSSIYGNWQEGGGTNGVTDKYLGLRFLISGVTHYGWAKLDADVQSPPLTGGVVLKSYYYNPNPNDPIQAGQTKTLSVENNSFDKIKLITKDKILTIVNLKNEANYSIYDITGKMIVSGVARNNRESIDMQSFSTGIMIIKLMDKANGQNLTKKIFVK